MRTVAIACLLMGAAVPAAAASSFTVTVGSPVQAIPGNNDFQSQLASKGLSAYTAAGASVTLNLPRKLRFEFLGAESGFRDTFTALSGPLSFTENNEAWTNIVFGTLNYGAGAITDWQFTTSGNGNIALIGSHHFGIFLPGNVGSTYNTNVLYLGFDDQINNFDDNHDDLVMRVVAVPEPSSWAMLIAGFGLVGAAQRRRVRKVAA
ncbi:PEPxxWA-CTERM sorting domain-containing protein [Sandarakinorhabdus sp.]|uniref:PEPxxWA-CTERM sorting domain-containing protein n=1 Tax=Sandarakinorhabdus sp. TaxID=1916663 RepID=UPI00286E06C2|nr:PEPxxWA-CTERM sorting domain-containing protein [Sandarakinorhabdus sp.]